jgi:transglutaminase-like putative cysteine protease
MPSGNVKGSILAVLVIAIVIVSSLGLLMVQKSGTSPEMAFTEGVIEYQNSNFLTAADLFWKSYQGYIVAGDVANANISLHWKFISERAIYEYSLNRSEAEAAVQAFFPDMTAQMIKDLLDEPSVEKMNSDGQTWYFGDVAINIAFRHPVLMKDFTRRSGGTPVFDTVLPLIKASQGVNETFLNLTDFIMTGQMTILRSDLPKEGVLQIWVPTPIRTASQQNITITITPEEYVVSYTSVDANLGLTYLEIPLKGLKDDITVSATSTFSEYQKHFDIDPENVGEYDTTSELYLDYTKSSANTMITPAIEELAKAIVGDETNPYLQAKLIYEHVIGNISYSHTPHLSLSALGIAESEYVRINMFGDCGAQSLYFSALMRSLGVPARSCGGYQMFPPGSGTHFWAEFYLPNYGWVPVDVTAAEAADWSYNATPQEVKLYQDFYFGNLDMYRMVLQNDEDIPLTPSSGDSVQFLSCIQFPTMVCSASDQDMAFYTFLVWSVQVTQA